MTPGEAAGRMLALESAVDGDELVTAYAADLVRDHGVSDERARETAKADLGWLLGEIGEDGRRRALAYLPGDVEHPLLGRYVERPSDEKLLEAGKRWALGEFPGMAER